MSDQTDRILDQAEIDSLLGLNASPTRELHAVEKIISSSIIPSFRQRRKFR